jgi:hypothetical protein
LEQSCASGANFRSPGGCKKGVVNTHGAGRPRRRKAERMKDLFLIQLVNDRNEIIDACTFKTETTFKAALKSDWVGACTVRAWNIIDVKNPIWIQL